MEVWKKQKREERNLTAERFVGVPEDVRLDRVEPSVLRLLDKIGPHLMTKRTRRGENGECHFSELWWMRARGGGACTRWRRRSGDISHLGRATGVVDRAGQDYLALAIDLQAPGVERDIKRQGRDDERRDQEDHRGRESGRRGSHFCFFGSFPKVL